MRALDRILEQGDSIWRATERGIELRVDPTVVAAFEEATAQPDAVSEQLAEAWTQAYGRQPDPSDAWDHAIKAVEATLIPIGRCCVGAERQAPRPRGVCSDSKREFGEDRLETPGSTSSPSS